MTQYADPIAGSTVGVAPTGCTLRGFTTNWSGLVANDGSNYIDHDCTSTNDDTHAITLDAPGSVTGAVEVLTSFFIPSGEITNGNPSGGAVIYCDTSAGQYYMAGWRGSSTVFSIVRFATGGIAQTVASAAYANVQGTLYWVRYSIDAAGNHSATIWADGQDELVDGVTIAAANTTLTTGHCGVGGYEAESTAKFRYFSIGTAGDAAPSPAGGGTIITQTLSDTVDIADPAVHGMIRGSVLTDGLTVTEGGTIVSTIFGLLMSDDILIADQSSQFFMRTRLAESSIVVTDEMLATIIGSAILTRILTSNIDVTDEAVYSILRNRLLQDTLVISEGQLEAYTTTNFLADDELTVTDSIVTRLLLTRLLGDSIDLSDSAIATIVGQNVISAILSSTIQTSDEAVRWMNRVRFGDSLVLTVDEVSKVLRFTRELTDAIDAADQSLSALQRFILLTDALSVDDSLVSLVNTPPTADPVILIGFDQPRIDIGGYAI